MISKRILGHLLLISLFTSLPCLFPSQRERSKPQRETSADHHKKWLTEDVVYIISAEEKAVFEKLSTVEEKDQFIEQFWQRRDPDPRTPINEFKIEHYRRIAYANEKFTSGDPGWLTDRGRVYIIHGPPDSYENRPDGGAYVRPISEGGGRTTVYPYEKWRYRHIDGIGQDVELEFVDKSNTGKFELAVFPWEKDALLHIGEGQTLAEEIGMARRGDHPAFRPAAGGGAIGPQNYFSRIRDLPFARYELVAKVQAAPIIKYPDLKELVKVNVQYQDVPFEVHQDYFRLNQGQVIVPITVSVNSKELTAREQGKNLVTKAAVYGIVTSLTNRIVAEFEDEFFVNHTREGLQRGDEKIAMYQKIIALDSRTRYKLDLVLKDVFSGKLGVKQTALIPPAFEEGKLSASSLVLSSHISPLEKIPETNDMFVLGDVRVLPSMDGSFSRQMPLGVYLQIYNTTLDVNDLMPSLQVIYRLVQNGQVLKTATDDNGESLQYFSPQRVVILKRLSLTDLQPGSYQIEVEVRDRLTDRKITLNSNFSVRES